MPLAYTRTLNILSEILGRNCDAIKPDTSLKQIDAFDSVAFVRLIVALDEAAGRQLEPEEIEGLACVSDIAKVLGGDA